MAVRAGCLAGLAAWAGWLPGWAAWLGWLPGWAGCLAVAAANVLTITGMQIRLIIRSTAPYLFMTRAPDLYQLMSTLVSTASGLSGVSTQLIHIHFDL